MVSLFPGVNRYVEVGQDPGISVPFSDPEHDIDFDKISLSINGTFPLGSVAIEKISAREGALTYK